MPRSSTPAVWVAVTVRPMTRGLAHRAPLADQVGGHDRLAVAGGEGVHGAQADGQPEGEDAEADGQLLAGDEVGEGAGGAVEAAGLGDAGAGDGAGDGRRRRATGADPHGGLALVGRRGEQVVGIGGQPGAGAGRGDVGRHHRGAVAHGGDLPPADPVGEGGAGELDLPLAPDLVDVGGKVARQAQGGQAGVARRGRSTSADVTASGARRPSTVDSIRRAASGHAREA